MGLIERFVEKVLVGDGCWEWTAQISPNGYGRIGVGGKKGGMQYAHRTSWRLFRGEIPGDLFVLHHCDNRKCVKPSHLFLGTAADNNRDCVRKGRNPRGERKYGAKLNYRKAEEIRSLVKTRTVTELAKRFGVSRNAIFQVTSNRTWVRN